MVKKIILKSARKRRLSFNEAVKNFPDKRKEEAYTKFPRAPYKRITYKSDESSVSDDESRLRKLWMQNNRKKFTHIHSHPYNDRNDQPGYLGVAPSKEDLETFLLEDECKTMVIVRVENGNNKPTDYLFIRKGKNFKNFGYSCINQVKEPPKDIEMTESLLANRLNSYERSVKMALNNDDEAKVKGLIERFALTYSLNVRYIMKKRKA